MSEALVRRAYSEEGARETSNGSGTLYITNIFRSLVVWNLPATLPNVKAELVSLLPAIMTGDV